MPALMKKPSFTPSCAKASAYNWPYVVYLVRDGYVEDAERVFFADYSLTTGWTGDQPSFQWQL